MVLALLTDSLLDPNRLSRVIHVSVMLVMPSLTSLAVSLQSEESPLYLATNWGHGDVVQMLLGDARTDVNIQV